MGSGVPESLLHPWPCDQDSPVHMQACVCSLPPPVQILAPAPSHCPGAHSDILDYGVSLLGHEGYNFFLLEAGQSRCLGPSVGCFFLC